ncbi:MAG: AAA family ATPase [Oscillospiraceae bacterium]
MLKRKIYNELVSWKKNNGATAMMIDGARRVGKSYIAEEFAKSEYKSYILIDFGKAPKDVLDLFVNDSSDLDLLLFHYLPLLHKRESLIYLMRCNSIHGHVSL